MKNSKLRRILMLMACAVLLVCLSVGATLAYLTSTTGVVENTFTVGKVILDDPDTDLNEGLDEAKTDEYGKEIPGAERVQGNEYKLIANHTYVKDPTVHVQKTSEPCYVRMLVSISCIDELEAITGDPFKPVDVIEGWSNDVWQYKGNEVKNNVGYYEFWFVGDLNTADELGAGIVDARAAKVDMPALFTHIKVPANATNEQLEALEDLEIIVIAQAVQADGFASQEAAWEEIARPGDWANFVPQL